MYLFNTPKYYIYIYMPAITINFKRGLKLEREWKMYMQAFV